MLIIESFHLQIRGQYSRPPLQLQRKIAMYLSRKFQILTDDHIISYHIYHFISYHIRSYYIYHTISYQTSFQCHTSTQTSIKNKTWCWGYDQKTTKAWCNHSFDKGFIKNVQRLTKYNTLYKQTKTYKTCPKWNQLYQDTLLYCIYANGLSHFK